MLSFRPQIKMHFIGYWDFIWISGMIFNFHPFFKSLIFYLSLGWLVVVPIKNTYLSYIMTKCRLITKCDMFQEGVKNKTWSLCLYPFCNNREIPTLSLKHSVRLLVIQTFIDPFQDVGSINGGVQSRVKFYTVKGVYEIISATKKTSEEEYMTNSNYTYRNGYKSPRKHIHTDTSLC